MNGPLGFVAFALFALVSLGSYLLLHRRQFYKWRINALVGLGGAAALAGIVFGLARVTSLEVMLLVGALLVPPYLMFFYCALRSFLRRRGHISPLKENHA